MAVPKDFFWINCKSRSVNKKTKVILAVVVEAVVVVIVVVATEWHPRLQQYVWLIVEVCNWEIYSLKEN